MRIHLIGIGGIAMGNFAAMLKQKGHLVTGSDQKLYPPMSDKIEGWGIPAREFSSENLKGIELCIVGNAISRGNVELEELLNTTHIEYMSLPQALRHFFLKGKEVISPIGTHGKTSMSFLLDHIISCAKLGNGLFAGGVRADGMDGFRIGEGRHFIVEGDEYDTAFFDKAPKFLHYRPRYILLHAIEYDHADIYPNFESYELAFKRLLRTIPSNGMVIASKDDVGVVKLLEGYSHSRVCWYSLSVGDKPMQYQINGHNFDLSFIKKVKNFALVGSHNQANSLAVSLLALHIGISIDLIKKSIESFPGVLRRQQIRLELFPKTKDKKGGIVFIEDFAHHPSSVQAILKSMRLFYSGRRLHIFFEPRSASNHRNIFQNLYTECFSQADSIYISEVFDRNKVPPQERMNVKEVVQNINIRKKTEKSSHLTLYPTAHYGKTPQELLDIFSKNFQPYSQGDVILALSNGNFGGIYSPLEKFLSSFSL